MRPGERFAQKDPSISCKMRQASCCFSVLKGLPDVQLNSPGLWRHCKTNRFSMQGAGDMTGNNFHLIYEMGLGGWRNRRAELELGKTKVVWGAWNALEQQSLEIPAINSVCCMKVTLKISRELAVCRADIVGLLWDNKLHNIGFRSFGSLDLEWADLC